MCYYNAIIIGAVVNSFDAALYIVGFALLAAAAVIDIREHRIPDKLIVSGAALCLTIRLLHPGSLSDSLIGGAGAVLILLLIHLITKGGIGLGDVKLFGCIGLYFGLENTVSAMLIAAMSSGLFSLVLICINRDNRKREIPFAPFMTAGMLAAVLL